MMLQYMRRYFDLLGMRVEILNALRATHSISDEAYLNEVFEKSIAQTTMETHKKELMDLCEKQIEMDLSPYVIKSEC